MSDHDQTVVRTAGSMSDHEQTVVRASMPVHEEPVARPHPEHVVLDIGGDTGALIIHADPEFHDLQIEICPSGHEDGKREHQHILERPMPGQTMYAAVFGGLPAGRYTLLTDNTVRDRDVLIEGAAVTTLDWRTEATAG